MIYVTNSEKETYDLAFSYAKKLHPGLVLCLNGEMGSGKTAFTRGLMAGLGYKGEVTSPTFALCHRYEGDLTVLHYDLYRLESDDDLYSIGFYDDVNDSVCAVIEWSGIADHAVGNDCIRLKFSYGATENERIITEE